MILEEEKVIIDKFYHNLEQISDIGIIDFSIVPSTENASEEFQFIICVEYNAHFKLTTEHVNAVFGSIKDKTKLYVEERITQTSNIYLKSKYLHFLYLLTKNNRYCSDAIDVYNLLLVEYIGNSQENYNIQHFQEILETIISLSEKIKYKTEELKERIIHYLKDNKVVSRIKTRIIQALTNSKLFIPSELSYIPQLCIALSKSENESNWIEKDLKLGLHFALKFPNDQNQICEIYELLGDNEYHNIRLYNGEDENIIIPHYNQSTYEKMMGYYRNAKNITKLEVATRLYNQNKRNLKFLKITSHIEHKKEDDFTQLLNNHFESIVNESTPLIVFDLCLGDKLLFIPNVKLDEFAKNHADKPLYQCFSPSHVDININNQKVEALEHCKFQIYGISVQNQLQFVIDIILHCIASKKLSYIKVANVLNKMTFFGKELIVNSNSNIEVSYTWISQIDFALKSFFSQCNLLLKAKNADWRITIDTLSLKFEGILRDIIGLKCGSITKIDKNDNTSEMLLDDLLRCNCFSEIFNEDDRNLFLYALTNKGCNIRNYVAHSFYKPQDYTFNKAVLILLCVLRLAKFYPQKENVIERIDVI